jgi:hypothetical protein
MEVPMLPERMLIAGLDAVSRAYAPPHTNEQGFHIAHQGASLLSHWFMVHDRTCEPAAAAVLEPLLAGAWLGQPDFAPRPDEAPAPAELERLLAALGSCAGTSDHAGHPIIFTSLALRAFRQQPALITRSRIEGLLRIATAMAPVSPLPSREALAAAPELVPAELATTALDGFAASVQVYTDYFQGYSGHVLTFGCAVLDLHDLGYTEVARQAAIGYREYVRRCRQGPSGPHGQWKRPGHGVAGEDPRTAAFWAGKPPSYLTDGIGHFGKYTYAWLALEARTGDRAVAAEARRLMPEVLW